VGEKNPCILSRALFDPTQLIGVENPQSHSVELHALGQHFFQEFTYSV
jgi:hypothetical protein